MSYGVDHRCSSGPALLWLWCRTAAVALIGLLVWELPYATDAALKKKKKKEYVGPLLCTVGQWAEDLTLLLQRFELLLWHGFSPWLELLHAAGVA